MARLSAGTLAVLLSLLVTTAAIADPPALFPAAGATSVCPDTPLRLTFAAAPTLGAAGKIRVFDAAGNSPVETIDISSPTSTQTIGGLPNYKYYPVIITGNQAAIYLHNHALKYNATYYVTMDAGVFKDDPGISDPSAWRFTTQSAPPAAGSTKLTIAADGTGDFCTIQGAVDFVPDGNKTPTTLLIRKGTYTELIYFAHKDALTIQGEDRKQCVIEYANNAKFNSASDQGTYHRGVFLANQCADLTLSNFTIRDTTPHGGSQAEAIILKGSPTAHAVLSDLDLYSFQDTLQINGQAYIKDCYIEGDVDFMWGTGPCFFENCHCYGLRSKGYYTQIRNTAKNHGYVYHHCTFDGPDGVENMFLSRIAPVRFPSSEVVLIDCVLGKSVGPAAWRLDGSTDAPNVHFWEFNSHDSAGNPVDTSDRLAISRQLQTPTDAATIAEYSNPSFVLGNNWTPPGK
jgi:pectin methylesterase-like acyl-CoA thioesterase